LANNKRACCGVVSLGVGGCRHEEREGREKAEIEVESLPE
jgi:hypothetical protein